MATCPKCEQECEVEEILHSFMDDAYGYRTVFFEAEYATSCCGEETDHDDHS